MPLGPIVTEALVDPTPQQLVLNVGAPRPNPFRTSTAIELALPKRGPVSVRVFDTGGRLVRTVVEATFEARRHELAWDGRDDAGQRVATGIYFVEVRAESRTFHRKVVLLR